MHHLVSQRLNAERIVVLGWSRAILLQLAHPLVAAGVAEHSSLHAGRISAILRLHHTIHAMLALAFGDDASRQRALDGIKAIHRRVHGHLPTAAGPFPAGTPYSAEDAELVLWVHATLLESIPLAYELLVRPLTPVERDGYCGEAASIAIDLGARGDDVPRTWSENAAYMERMYRSGTIAVSAQARTLSTLVVSPPFGWLVAPATWMNRLVTLGLLPGDIRHQYAFTWSRRHAKALGVAARLIRSTRRVMPDAIALWPEARRPADIIPA